VRVVCEEWAGDNGNRKDRTENDSVPLTTLISSIDIYS
jgi:hypothetical protein